MDFASSSTEAELYLINHMLEMSPNFDALRLIGAVFGTARCVRTIKLAFGGNIQERPFIWRHLQESPFKMTGPLLLKLLVY